jgi:hypothetical protein
MVDVASGWVRCAGLRDKRQETVFHALQRLQAELLFRSLGLDSDNGTEFINRLELPAAAGARAHPRPRTRLRQLPAPRSKAGEQDALWSARHPPLRCRSDALPPTHQHGVLSIKMMYQLQARAKHIDPYRLEVQLEAAQRTLAARAVRSDSYVRQS